MSIRERADFADMPWLHDFRYERRIYRAQGKDVVAYTMAMKDAHIRSLQERNLPWIHPTASADTNWVVGHSYGWPEEPVIPPQPIYGYLITDQAVNGEKIKVVLVGGNHAREDPACWSLHGMIEFLVSEDPRARLLRERFAFYVYPSVNPDGKWHLVSPAHRALMHINSSPELRAGGENNHNRVWNTHGRFASIDVSKAAMRKDTGGAPCYLLDFHGIPWLSYVFADANSAGHPLLDTLRMNGFNFRRSRLPGTAGTLRAWSIDPEGLNAAHGLAPELASKEEGAMLERGKRFALAFYDMSVTDNVLKPDFSAPDIEPLPPPPPLLAWMLDGTASPLFGGMKGDMQGVESRADGPFQAGAIRLTDPRASVDFGAVDVLDGHAGLTVSFWIRGTDEPAETRYLVSRYQARDNQRSWAVQQSAQSRDLRVTLSADGTHTRARLKRHLTTRWPHDDVLGEEWRHFAFTFEGGDGGTLRVYVDGRPIEMGFDGHYFDDNPVDALYAASVPLTIGSLIGSANAFTGDIAELALWGEALDPAQIRWVSKYSLDRLREDR